LRDASNGETSLSGTGVTFYVHARQFYVYGSPTVNLSAPTSGPTAGVVYCQAAGDDEAFAINSIDPTLLNVSATWKTAPGCSGAPFQGPQCIVTVQVAYPYSFLSTFGWTIDFNSTSQMPISQ